MQISKSIALKATVLLGAASSVNAFWRMPCRSRSGLARIDPLVSNGSLSEHAHAIHGSGGFDVNAGYDALMAGDCTSCEVTQDKSAYWIPALYFQDSTGSFTLVNQVGGLLAYYLLYPNAGNDSLSGFPAGFEMIAGDTNQRNFSYPVPDIPKSDWTGVYQTQAFLRQAALGFNCLNYAITPEGSLYRHFLPDKAYLDAHCTDGVRFELMFPSCWNGNRNIPANKKDHVAYPSQVMTGDCPEGFGERLPSLFYEIIWDTYAFKGQDGQFVLANGDPTGYGFHGDFMMGWDEKFLQSAVDTCTDLSGQIQDCKLFDIQSDADAATCNITVPEPLIHENVLGTVHTLPGNPPIQYGPGYATGAAAGAAPHSANPSAATTTQTPQPAPTLSYSAGSSIASTDTYVPGAIFLVSHSTAAATPSPTDSPTDSPASSPTDSSSVDPVVQVAQVTPAPSAAATDSSSYFSTYYTTSGREVLEVLWVEEVVTVTADTTSTVTLPGRKDRKRHLHQHKRHVGDH